MIMSEVTVRQGTHTGVWQAGLCKLGLYYYCLPSDEVRTFFQEAEVWGEMKNHQRRKLGNSSTHEGASTQRVSSIRCMGWFLTHSLAL